MNIQKNGSKWLDCSPIPESVSSCLGRDFVKGDVKRLKN